MALFKMAFAATVAYGLYRYFRQEHQQGRAAFAAGESTPGNVDVRNAGPQSMASDPPEWDHVDQASDESYPASDPPSANRFT